MHRDLGALLKDIADQARLSPREIEQGMGKPYGSFRDSLNPNRAAVFPADDLPAFMDTYQTDDPLHWLAAKRGKRVVDLARREPDGRNLDHEFRQAHDALARLSELVEQYQAGEVEYTALTKQAGEIQAEVEDVIKRARSEKQGCVTLIGRAMGGK
ncbi:hypothetical protein PCS_02605 [Desulfocurvibacter africanus PCS]|uniref:Uncharacterized protein n=1 Tax=Desulfocurvibacter africanus PCS TaxID=1262666 RepID=M5Q1J0_DESAF|nr:hypothetical protein [Desulfocurvibacter africanus]EMG36593.1 hypothetical protein PCS_02605 [Desulfocurvibacter africanus PCS]